MQEDSAHAWLDAQMEPGIRRDSTTMYLDNEVRQIIEDSVYAAWVYTRPITMVQFRDALQLNNLRLAFWYAVRLYKTDRETLLPILLAYEELIPVERVLKSGFETYTLLDPRVTRIIDGKPNVMRPDILDEELHLTNSVIADLLQAKQTQTGQKP